MRLTALHLFGFYTFLMLNSLYSLYDSSSKKYQRTHPPAFYTIHVIVQSKRSKLKLC